MPIHITSGDGRDILSLASYRLCLMQRIPAASNAGICRDWNRQSDTPSTWLQGKLVWSQSLC